MTVNEFAAKVAKREGGKEEVNIAQIMDILKAVDSLLDGCLYKLIEWR